MDIITLSTVSSTLRKSIFSPIGWKLLNRIFTPYPIIIRELMPIEVKGMGQGLGLEMEALQYSLPQDEKNLRKSRVECRKELMQVYQKFKAKQEQFCELQGKLKSEKTQVGKLLLQREYFKRREEVLHQENLSYKQQLRAVNIGFNDKIKLLDRTNQELLQENSKLNNQKGALVNKIREYQNEIQTIKSESEKSKAILKRIKNYLLYKEL